MVSQCSITRALAPGRLPSFTRTICPAQYLRPSRNHMKVHQYVTPEAFEVQKHSRTERATTPSPVQHESTTQTPQFLFRTGRKRRRISVSCTLQVGPWFEAPTERVNSSSRAFLKNARPQRRERGTFTIKILLGIFQHFPTWGWARAWPWLGVGCWVPARSKNVKIW